MTGVNHGEAKKIIKFATKKKRSFKEFLSPIRVISHGNRIQTIFFLMAGSIASKTQGWYRTQTREGGEKKKKNCIFSSSSCLDSLRFLSLIAILRSLTSRNEHEQHHFPLVHVIYGPRFHIRSTINSFFFSLFFYGIPDGCDTSS